MVGHVARPLHNISLNVLAALLPPLRFSKSRIDAVVIIVIMREVSALLFFWGLRTLGSSFGFILLLSDPLAQSLES